MRLFEGTEFDIPPRCERCNELMDDCRCQPIPEPSPHPTQQTAIVSLEKRKRGKMVTVVRGLSLQNLDLAALTTTLKKHCGAGGTVKHDEKSTCDMIEIQGDQRDKVIKKLSEIGFHITPR